MVDEFAPYFSDDLPDSAVMPHRLHQQAHDEFPDDREAARLRYIELMIEHGHIINTAPKRTIDGPNDG